MVTDEDLVGWLREFLRTSDVNTTTKAIVRRRLEEDFGIDLSDKKAFIREQVHFYLQNGDDEIDEESFENESVEDDEEEATTAKSSTTRRGPKHRIMRSRYVVVDLPKYAVCLHNFKNSLGCLN